jgi:hypothetical protein
VSTALASQARPTFALLRSGAVVAVALAAVVYSKLALPAALFAFLSFLAIPREPASLRKRQLIAHATAGVVAAGAVFVFLAREAVPGMVQGGTSASGQRAVSRLREILFAQDSARKAASLDPDADGVGSALLIGELTGELGMRGQARLFPPLLERYPKLDLTRAGPAIEIGGFWFMVCVPTSATEFSSDPKARFDDEVAERRYVAYAWPSGRAPGLLRAYFIDEHERILGAPSRPTLRRGADYPPTCDDALAPETRDAWRPWRNKQAREELPGAP